MPDNKAKLKHCRNLMAAPPEVDRNREPPKCKNCMYYQPEFRYRRCLYASCPYGKGRNTAFRKQPLKEEKIALGGG